MIGLPTQPESDDDDPDRRMSTSATREPGRWAGQIAIAEDFDETSEELVASFQYAIGDEHDAS